MRRANVFTSDFDYDDSDPDGYRSGEKRAGGEAPTVRVYELPPGQSVCPYHYEYEEEWLLVLEGAVVVRVPDGEHELTRGDLVCFPPGPTGAHKVTNRAEPIARVTMFSSARRPA